MIVSPYTSVTTWELWRLLAENVILNVTKEFYASKGDAAAYMEILMKYYWSCVPANKMTTEAEGDPNHDFQMAIACELEATSVRDFDNAVDLEYEQALIALVGWSEATTEPLSNDRVKHYYQLFQDSFPLTHMVFSTIVSSKSKQIDLNPTMFPSKKVCVSGSASVIPLGDLTTTYTGELTLHKKERTTLNSWLALIRARSRDPLKTWSRVESFGYFYKGYQQPAVSTLSGGATCNIRTAWKNQDELYDKCMPTFNETLQGESCMGGAVDNSNRLVPQKSQIDNKSSINHALGRRFFAKRISRLRYQQTPS